MKSVFYLFKNNGTSYKVNSVEEIVNFYKNKKMEPWERNIWPSYFEIYEFENGYTPEESFEHFGIDPSMLDKNKKYAIFERFIEIDYEDPIEKLDEYIEKNGQKAKYISYDYDSGFYICGDKVFSDRLSKFVNKDEVKKFLEEIDDAIK